MKGSLKHYIGSAMKRLPTDFGRPRARVVRALQAALVGWFHRGHRKLPWRDDPTPYRVWVSEIMAQQTRIETVVPFFDRFVARFPDARALAAAPLDDVLALWSGLGYYTRARNLHAAARMVVARHGGEVPADADALRALPGIGRYTAGAIASIAFGRRVPVVDGNVTRIFARVFDVAEDVADAAARRRLWEIAAALADADDPGALNHGLMELGARICTPRNPACPTCPLRAMCWARRRGTIAARPVKAPKKPPARRAWAGAVIRRANGAVLLARNPDGGLFGGLWSLPLYEAAGRSVAGRRESLAAALAADLGRSPVVGERLARTEHVLSHRRLVLDLFEIPWRGPSPRFADGRLGRWVRTHADLAELGISTLTRKALAAAGFASASGRVARAPSPASSA